jgi:hypothetical protein
VAGLIIAEPIGSWWLAVAGVLKRLVLIPRTRRQVFSELTTATHDRTGVGYLGEGESLEYLASLHGAAGELPRARPVSPAAFRRLIRSRSEDQLLYVEINRLLAPLLPPGALFSHPWITQKVIMDGEPRRSASRSLEAVYGRKIRKHGLDHRIATDSRSVSTFYREFYLPYLEWRFGQASHPRTECQLLYSVRSGFLLQVWHEDRWVAGVVCRLHRHRVVALAFGVRPPYREHLHRGALSAASYFLIRWAAANDLREVDLLRSRPHRDDGIFEHKRRLGAEPCWDPWPHTTIALYPPVAASLPPPAAGILVRTGATAAVPIEQVLDASRRTDHPHRASAAGNDTDQRR